MKFAVSLLALIMVLSVLESRMLVSCYDPKDPAWPIGAEWRLTRLDLGATRNHHIRKMNLHGLIERGGDVLYSKFMQEVFVERKTKGLYEFTFWRQYLQVPFTQVTPAEWIDVDEDCRFVYPTVLLPKKIGQYKIQVAFHNATGHFCDANFFIYIYVQTERNLG